MTAHTVGDRVLTQTGKQAQIEGFGIKLRFSDGSTGYFDESVIADEADASTADLDTADQHGHGDPQQS